MIPSALSPVFLPCTVRLFLPPRCTVQSCSPVSSVTMLRRPPCYVDVSVRVRSVVDCFRSSPPLYPPVFSNVLPSLLGRRSPCFAWRYAKGRAKATTVLLRHTELSFTPLAVGSFPPCALRSSFGHVPTLIGGVLVCVRAFVCVCADVLRHDPLPSSI